MKPRTAITIIALAVCLGSVWAVLAQRQQLAVLRSERQALWLHKTPPGEDSAMATQQSHDASSADSSEELLRLRSEVTRLTARKRGLAGVTQENERLRSQLENSQTNVPAHSQLPAGYMRKAQAQFAGYSTPENSFRSFVWALQNHDSNILLQSLTPGAAQKLQARFQDPSQVAEFFKESDAVPGFALQNRKEQPDGSVQFEVEVVPGTPKETMSVQLIGGEWKLDLPF